MVQIILRRGFDKLAPWVTKVTMGSFLAELLLCQGRFRLELSPKASALWFGGFGGQTARRFA